MADAKTTKWIAELIVMQVGYVRAQLQEDLDRGQFMTGAPYQPSDIADLTIGIAHIDKIISEIS